MAVAGISARRRTHVTALCAEHRITWNVVRGQPATADPAAKVISTPAVTMVRSYFVALHQVGRCVLHGGSPAPGLTAAAAVWSWAIEVAIEDPSPGLRRHIFPLPWADLQGTNGAAGVLPGPEDPVWWMLGRLDDSPRLLYEAARLATLERRARQDRGGECGLAVT